MSTYSQTINELRQNNWKTLSNIKTRNLEIAKIESKRFQDQGKLLNLAGQFGAEVIGKWEDKVNTDKENDVRVDFMLNQMEDWAGSDEANDASNTLLDIKKKQDGVSEFLVKARSDGAPSHAIHEAENRTGKWSRVSHVLNATSIGQGYDGYVNNQLLHNDDMFQAFIDGKPVDITVNDPSKSFKQAIATRNYLRKEYFNLHNVNEYTKEFLALSTDRGGSGFYAQILKADKAAYVALEKQYDIRDSLDKQAFTQQAWHRTKTSESLQDVYNALANGVNEKGKPIGHEGAHKFIREEIFTPGIKSRQITLDDLKVIAGTEINGSILGERWPQFYSVEPGNEGTLVREYFDAQDELDEDDNKQGLVGAKIQGKNLIKAIHNGKVTSEANFDEAIDQIHKIDKGNLYDYDKVFRAWESRKESPEKVNDTVNDLIARNKKGKYITDLVESESLSVKNHPRIQRILKQEEKILGRADVKKGIADIRGKFLIDPKSFGLRADEYKSIGAFRASQLREEYFINQIEQGQEASAALTQTQIWWEKNGGDSDKTDRKQFTKGNKLGLFATDNNGKYPNVEAQIAGTALGKPNYEGNEDGKYAADARTYVVQNKDKEEKALETDQFVKEEFEGNYTKALQAIDETTKKAAYQISAENKLFNNDVDYNNLLEQTGMATTWMMEEARRAGMSLGEWMNLRQIAHGKPPLTDEFLDYLGEDDVMNLKSGMKNRLNGHTVDGLFRPEEISGTLAKANNTFNIVQKTTYSNDNLGNAAQNIFNLPVNEIGKITVTGKDADSVKTVGCIATAIGCRLSNTFSQDFDLGKEYEFTEMIAQIPIEQLLHAWEDPDFAKDMYSLTGSVYHLPLEDFLRGSELDERYKQFRFDDLNRYKYNPENDEEEEEEDKADEALQNLLETDVVKKSRSKNLDGPNQYQFKHK
tara:strand:- start:5117 stop:7897 length:2781 start_codon:yes stop_codon:yes gene_type:complete